jgi:hypothetical protein
MNQNTSTPIAFSFSKVLPALLALAAPLAFAASCSSGDTGDASIEPVESTAEALTCKCASGNTICPPANAPPDNECGSWKCNTLACSCTFVEAKALGEKCKPNGGGKGVCAKQGSALVCCTGCVDKKGNCLSGDAVAACGAGGKACETCKSDACNEADCKEGACVLQPINDGGDCNDGNACTVNDKCSNGVCKGGGALNCSDGNPCTVDVCDPALGCTTHDPVPNDPPTPCNDGNFCTGPDVCVDGTCRGEPVVCNDFKPCTDDTCNPATGCVHTPKNVNAPCDDGSSCTTGETCQDDDDDPTTPLVCKPAFGEACNGGNPCIDPDCENGSCPAEPVFLDGAACQTSLCMEGETCSAGNCQGGKLKDCDDGNPCTIDTCNDLTGCLHVPVPANTTVLCDDANPCTINDRCDGDTCRGTEIECTPLDSCHKAGKCNAEDGMCSDPRQPNGTPCDVTGKCQEGVCIGGTVTTPGEGGTNGEGGGGAEPGTSNGGENAAGGSAGEGSGAKPSDDPNQQGGVYKRKPGGFSCSLPGAPNERRAGAWLGVLLVAGASLLRRRRAA